MSSLSNFEKKLVQGANPDLLEFLCDAFKASVADSESVISLVNAESYDGAKIVANTARTKMAAFLDKLKSLQHEVSLKTQEESGEGTNNNDVKVVTPESPTTPIVEQTQVSAPTPPENPAPPENV